MNAENLQSNIHDVVLNWMGSLGASDSVTHLLAVVASLIFLIIICYVSDIITKRIIVSIVVRIIKRTKNTFDDIFLQRNVFNRLAHIVPAWIFYALIPATMPEYERAIVIMQDLTFVWMILVVLLTISAFLDAVHDIYGKFPISENRPIKGYVQLLKIITYVIGVLGIISIVGDIDMTNIFAGIGALAAVLILVFKDTILGLVASVQLSGNDMVKPGDWISMPGYKADGTVLEITLNTVKVQNWDKTISTIPTYALVANSFQNWRGMEESGGRRIKRSINIDMTSVKFASPELLKKFKTFHVLKDFIIEREDEIAAFNKELNVKDGEVYNGRRMTNLGIFRHYLEFYLQNHPKIRKDMTFLVRQLDPTEKGIPMEIYVFSKDQEWAKYEGIQSDIFDHLLAIIPEFELRVFQNPAGSDILSLKNA